MMMRAILLAAIMFLTLILTHSVFARSESQIFTKKISSFDSDRSKRIESPVERQNTGRKKRKNNAVMPDNNNQKTKNRRLRGRYANQEVSYRRKTNRQVIWKERPPFKPKKRSRRGN